MSQKRFRQSKTVMIIDAVLLQLGFLKVFFGWRSRNIQRIMRLPKELYDYSKYFARERKGRHWI